MKNIKYIIAISQIFAILMTISIYFLASKSSKPLQFIEILKITELFVLLFCTAISGICYCIFKMIEND